MTKVTLKGLALHKTRAVLTTLAVVIGVAMISGAYVVSDTMLSAANSLSTSAYDNTDAVVTAKQSFKAEDTIGTSVTVKPSQLEQVRQNPNVAMATGDITEPAVVFADEPTGNLDSASSDEILSLLRRASDERGQTTVMVTHDAHAASYADRVVFLADGKIVRHLPDPTEASVLEAIKEVAAA